MHSENELREKLRQNWRNQLKLSEKNEFIFNISKEYTDFQWIMACFEKLRKEKKFYGHSIELLESLFHTSFDQHNTHIAIVSLQNDVK